MCYGNYFRYCSKLYFLSNLRNSAKCRYLCYTVNMEKLNLLLNAIQNDVFTLSDASRAGLSRYYLTRLIEEEKVTELQKGVFQKRSASKSDDMQTLSFKAATAKLKERSAVCLWSALSYYGLTDEVPKDVWFILPYPYGLKSVKSIRLKDPKWDIGIVKNDGFSVTSIERTIVDCFLNSKYVPVSEAFEAMKRAIKDKKTSSKKLLNMASKLGAKEKLLPFLEIAL